MQSFVSIGIVSRTEQGVLVNPKKYPQGLAHKLEEKTVWYVCFFLSDAKKVVQVRLLLTQKACAKPKHQRQSKSEQNQAK